MDAQPTEIRGALNLAEWVPEGMGACYEDRLGRRARASRRAVECLLAAHLAEDLVVTHQLECELPARCRWRARVSTHQRDQLCARRRAQIESVRSVAQQHARPLHLLAIMRSNRGKFRRQCGVSFFLALRHAGRMHALSKSDQAFLPMHREQCAGLSMRGFAKWHAIAVPRVRKRSRREQTQFAVRSRDRAPEPILRVQAGIFQALEDRKVEFFRGPPFNVRRGQKGGPQL